MNPVIPLSHRSFQIIQVGAGGNGGYLTQRLSKMIRAFSDLPAARFERPRSFVYSIVDGDLFETKNLSRQPCLEEDVDQNKAVALAERYGDAYDIQILAKPDYIESVQDLLDMEAQFCSMLILVGCVDNDATRRIMHEFFLTYPHDIIYIDSAVDAYQPDDPYSGYSGHVVCGVKLGGKVLLEPVGMLFPDILENTASKLPTEACGDVVVYEPQRMMANEMAAVIMAGQLNMILGSYEIHVHQTNFNARLMLSRSTYISPERVPKLQQV